MKYRFFGISYFIVFSASRGEKGLVYKKCILKRKLAGLLLDGLIEKYEFHSWPKGNDFSLMVFCSYSKKEIVIERLIKIFTENGIEAEEQFF